MARKDKAGNWLDPRGRAVPQAYVKPLDRARDRLVEKIVSDQQKLAERMRKLKADHLRRIGAYIEKLEKDLGAPRSGKGNLTLTNFSGDKQVEFSLNDILEFDERLRVAKSLIDQCLIKWSKDANTNLRVVVDQAFQVDKKGRVDTKAILRLKDLHINDREWQRAIDLLLQSLRVVGTRKYLTVRTRPEPGARFKTINLNFSSIEPE